MITKEKWDALQATMQRLGIQEADLWEKFILGSGSGGQNLQKTSSCVYLQHIPSGLDVKCQKTRSREDNRYFARKLLCEQIETIQKGELSTQEKERQKIRKQKQKRSKRAKEKILADKKAQARKKEQREPIAPHESP